MIHILLFISAALLIYILSVVIYRLFLDPLSKYPGPWLAHVTRLRFAYHNLRGDHIYDTEKLHKQYGDVVRVAPDELSYMSTPAWKEIQGHQAGRGVLEKDSVFFNTIASGPLALPALPSKRHGEVRRLVSHSFSATALKDQEHVVQGFVDVLIQKLHQKAGAPIDITGWFNHLTFDVASCLVFGESFGSLEAAEYHPWVKVMFDSVKYGVWQQLPSYFPFAAPLISWVVPKYLVEARKEAKIQSRIRFEERLQKEPDHIDFMVKILEPDNGISQEEQLANAELLIGAGSETTATSLSGTLYLLLRNPPCLEQLVKEVRSSFQAETAMTFTTIDQLQYLGATLNESLRMYPPVPGRAPRRTGPKGDEILGKWVPPNTSISMAPWAVNHSPKHFRFPYEFHLERWLKQDPRFDNDDREALHPFSVGPRTCLGQNLAYMEMRLTLAKLLWNFDVELIPGSVGWMEVQKAYFLWEKPALKIKLTPVMRQME